MKRMFKCENGHEYKSRTPVTTDWVELSGKSSSQKWIANDLCKICKSPIISETCYENGKVIMGAIRVSQ